jgi:V8-like Glu-specific endopeptidase
MRVTGPEMHSQQRRRRRYVAAALCLGSVAAVTVATFLTQQRAAQSQGATTQAGAAGARAGAGGTGALPSPQPLGSQPAAYPFGTASAGAVGGTLRAGTLPSGSGTAGPASVSPAPNVVGPVGTGSGGAESAPFLAKMAPTSPSSSMTVSNPMAATAFAGMPQVGAIIDNSSGAADAHFCSGSVVDSEYGDVVITAAHCVYDTGAGAYVSDIAFVPGYHDGQQPYGVWTPSKVLVPQQWIDSGDPDYDVAFIVVHQAGSSQRIQDQVGADQLGLNPSYTGLVQVVGYPDTTEQPVTCTNYTKELGPTQLEFDCPGFPDGTSGGPFLADVDPQTGQGTVVGVIGGYETGGETPDVSYSAYFGSAVADLFSQAEAVG